MASAIGLRGYLITAHRKGNPAMLSFDADDFVISPREFIASFISSNASTVQDDDRERSWYFEQKASDGPGNSKGYVKYGTFGFESDFVSTKTKKRNYRRKIDDVEEIPLFYEFWCPNDISFGLVAFQSFQGRSCITLVMGKIQESFENQNPGFQLRYRKLLPNDGSGSLYNAAPVKRLRLIKRNAAPDTTDRYLGDTAPDSVNFEVRLSARRNGILGTFGKVSKSLRENSDGVVLHEGIAFDKAVADVKIGGKYRPVGVFGDNSEAGVIDITQDIVRGPDGHPTFESLQKQCDAILTDFYEVAINKAQ